MQAKESYIIVKVHIFSHAPISSLDITMQPNEAEHKTCFF